MSKLILYSDQINEKRELDHELLRLLNKQNPSIGYIPSASDLTRKYFNVKVDYYKDLGITNLRYFDLDKECDETKINEVFDCDAIHLSGGNTFYFLYLLRKRNFIEKLRTYVHNGGVLIGISAGSILMTKTIALSGLGEDVDDNFIGIQDLSALGLVEFEFMPHLGDRKNHNALKQIEEYAKSKNTSVYCCENGSGVVVDGDSIKLIGDVIKV